VHVILVFFIQGTPLADEDVSAGNSTSAGSTAGSTALGDLNVDLDASEFFGDNAFANEVWTRFTHENTFIMFAVLVALIATLFSTRVIYPILQSSEGLLSLFPFFIAAANEPEGNEPYLHSISRDRLDFQIRQALLHDDILDKYEAEVARRDSTFGKYRSHLKQHKAAIHDIDVKWFKCDKCDYKSKENSTFKQHKANIHGVDVKWLKCDQCDFKSKNNSNLKTHKANVHGVDVKWFKCNQCVYKCKNNGHLKQHKAHVHGIDVKWFKCDECVYKCKRNSSLKNHEANVHGIDVRWFKCDRCEYKCKENGSLKVHKARHHGSSAPPAPPAL